MSGEEERNVEAEEAPERIARARGDEPLPEELPVLPLRNTVLFPSLVAPMVATTERAKRLVDDALASDRLLVTVAARDPEVTEPAPGRPVQGRHGGARAAHGQERRRLAAALGPGPAPGGDRGLARRPRPTCARGSRPLEETSTQGLELEALHRNVSRQFAVIAEGSQNVSEPVRTMVSQLQDSSALGDVVAANLGLSVEERQHLLETLDVQQRLERLSEHLAREAEVRSLEQEIRSQVQEELSRSQREYVLREQARAIRRQLGEYESPSEQVDELRKRIEDAKVPESVMEVAERELTRLAAQPPGAMEAGTIRTYLEWIADLPWSEDDRRHARGRARARDPERGPLRHREGEGAHPRVHRRAQAEARPARPDPLLRRPARHRQDLARPLDRARARAQVRAPLAGRRARRGRDPRPPPHLRRLAARPHPADPAPGGHQQPGVHARRDRQAGLGLPRRPVVGAARGARPRAELRLQRPLPRGAVRPVEGAVHRDGEPAREHPAGAARPHGGDRAARLHRGGQARDRAPAPAARGSSRSTASKSARPSSTTTRCAE